MDNSDLLKNPRTNYILALWRGKEKEEIRYKEIRKELVEKKSALGTPKIKYEKQLQRSLDELVTVGILKKRKEGDKRASPVFYKLANLQDEELVKTFTLSSLQETPSTRIVAAASKFWGLEAICGINPEDLSGDERREIAKILWKTGELKEQILKIRTKVVSRKINTLWKRILDSSMHPVVKYYIWSLNKMIAIEGEDLEEQIPRFWGEIHELYPDLTTDQFSQLKETVEKSLDENKDLIDQTSERMAEVFQSEAARNLLVVSSFELPKKPIKLDINDPEIQNYLEEQWEMFKEAALEKIAQDTSRLDRKEAKKEIENLKERFKRTYFEKRFSEIYSAVFPMKKEPLKFPLDNEMEAITSEYLKRLYMKAKKSEKEFFVEIEKGRITVGSGFSGTPDSLFPSLFFHKGFSLLPDWKEPKLPKDSEELLKTI